MIITKGGYEKVDMWALSSSLTNELKKLNLSLDNKVTICIHCGVEGQHSATGFHPKGMAIDLHFEQDGEIIQPAAMIHHLLKNWRGGIGIYTHWNNPGFHLDVGPTRTWWKKAGGTETHKLSEFLTECGINAETA